MRSKLIVLAAAAGALSVVGVAEAQAPTVMQTITAKASPNKAGTKAKPKGTKLTVGLATTTSDGSPPPTTAQSVVSLARELRFNGKEFASCKLATLNDASQGPSKCPKGSKVGTGTATAVVGTTGLKETLTVTAFNGPSGKSLLLYLSGSSPAAIAKAIEGKLGSASGVYGKKLTVAIPQDLQQPIQGLYAPLENFTVSIKATVTKRKLGIRKKINYIDIVSCKRGKLAFKVVNTFAPGSTSYAAPSTATGTTTAACTK